MASSKTQAVIESRRWLTERARGATLEIGVGEWPSLEWYPEHLDLTGLERDARALRQARRTVARLGRSATVVEGDAMALDFEPQSFDTVVFSFSLCSVPEVRGALLEALRVLRPGGVLLMADHVVSTSRPIRVIQRTAQLVTRPLFGEHFTRRPSLVARELDLEIIATERLSKGVIERLHAVVPG